MPGSGATIRATFGVVVSMPPGARSCSATYLISSRPKGAGIPPAQLTPHSGGLLFHRVRVGQAPVLRSLHSRLRSPPARHRARTSPAAYRPGRMPRGLRRSPLGCRGSAQHCSMPWTYDNQQRLPAGQAPGFRASRSLGLRGEVRRGVLMIPARACGTAMRKVCAALRAQFTAPVHRPAAASWLTPP